MSEIDVVAGQIVDEITEGIFAVPPGANHNAEEISEIKTQMIVLVKSILTKGHYTRDEITSQITGKSIPEILQKLQELDEFVGGKKSRRYRKKSRRHRKKSRRHRKKSRRHRTKLN
jgi:hypothetical protein